MLPSNVTVIVPIYCTTEESLVWLDECLSSVIDNGCKLVVHDDGSTLDVRPIVSKYNYDSYTSAENYGVSFARNTAAKNVETELLLPLDCDDRLATGAVEKLLEYWTGTPVYPDVRKFGLKKVPHYVLLEFDCEHLINKVGFTSVNVLHSVDQWKSVGGWDEQIKFYEDGEYNARLMGTYCGIRCPFPLVEYRMHESQRTKMYRKHAKNYAKSILSKVRRYEMACPGCGKKKLKSTKSVTNFQSSPEKFTTGEVVTSAVVVSSSVSADMPLESNGRVLSRYVGGKGKGRHYYRGIRTKYPYKVIYGDFVYADKSDVHGPDDTNSSMLILIVRPSAPKPVVTSEPKVIEPKPEPVKVEREAVKSEVVRTPVEVVEEVDAVVTEEGEEYEEDTEVVVEDLPDIGNMTVKDVYKLEVDGETAAKLLESEERGLGRRKVMEWLQSRT